MSPGENWGEGNLEKLEIWGVPAMTPTFFPSRPNGLAVAPFPMELIHRRHSERFLEVHKANGNAHGLFKVITRIIICCLVR